jgi:Uma2 family endonuclease
MAEWAALPDSIRGELVDGLLEEEEMPTRLHELVVGWFFNALWAWAVPRGGLVFGSEHKIAVTQRRGRKPDVSVELPAAADQEASASLTTVPPRIVVEVISPTLRDTRRDRIDKAREYARFGVRSYWLVDPAVRTLEIFVLGPDHRYVLAVSAGDGKVRPPACRGLVLDLDGLWSLASRQLGGSSRGRHKRRKA